MRFIRLIVSYTMSATHIAVIVALFMASVQGVSLINHQPFSIPGNHCVLELTVTLRASSMWKAGTYSLYACGSSTNINNSPVRWCTNIGTLEQLEQVHVHIEGLPSHVTVPEQVENDAVYSCLVSPS